MRLFQAALDTPRDSPVHRHPLSSRFALHGLRALDLCFSLNLRYGARNEFSQWPNSLETTVKPGKNTNSIRPGILFVFFGFVFVS